MEPVTRRGRGHFYVQGNTCKVLVSIIGISYAGGRKASLPEVKDS